MPFFSISGAIVDWTWASRSATLEGLDQDLHLAGLDLGEVEDVVDQAEEVPAGDADLGEVGDEALLAELRGFLDEHFAVADDGVERRAQLVAHIGEELALRLVGGVGLLLGLLQLALALLELGDVGVDGDRAAVRRLPLADPDPAAIGIMLLDHAVRLAVLAEAAREPGFRRHSAEIGDAALDDRRGDDAKLWPGTIRSTISG